MHRRRKPPPRAGSWSAWPAPARSTSRSPAGTSSPLPTRCRPSCSCRSRATTTRTWPPASGWTTRSTERLRAESILYDRAGGGEFLHFFTRTINGLFFEVLERRGGYDRYGEPNAPARLAAQAMLDRSLGEAITELRG